MALVRKIKLVHSLLLVIIESIVFYFHIYLKVCRNINQVKICMETGRMVVLLNLHNLYESLYDLLNQVHNMLYMLNKVFIWYISTFLVIFFIYICLIVL